MPERSVFHTETRALCLEHVEKLIEGNKTQGKCAVQKLISGAARVS